MSQNQKVVKCEIRGCEKPATKSWSWDYDYIISVCEDHYQQLQKQKELERKKEEEERKKKEEAIDRARRLLTLADNEINFIRKWIDKEDDSYSYIGLGKRVPKEVYIALAKAGAIKKCYDDEVNEIYYKVDEAKATPILQQFGYKVISLSEWEKRRQEAERILKEVGLNLWALRHDHFYLER
jgi:hypothetical protein